jgi:GNAT superfamily N-acetyltransferase
MSEEIEQNTLPRAADGSWRPNGTPVPGMLGESNLRTVRVVPLEGRRELTQFVKVPWAIYADDPNWVPPLIVERRQHLSRRRNPFFAHARARFWLAYRGNEPVGRISAQIDDLHLERHRDSTGFFGLLEAPDDPAVFASLLSAAEEWLRQQGMRRVIGPFNLSINDEIGTLVDGFDTPPMFMMGHARPYYDARIKEQGYGKAKDVVAYIRDARLAPPKVMQEVVRRTAARVHVRPLRLPHLKEELATLREIFNDAWSENWNYVPFTAAELDNLGSSLRLFIPPDFVQIAEVDGEAAGMIVAVPNLNEIIRDLDGRLFPGGLVRLLWRLARRGPKSARIPLMGILRKHQRSSLGMALVFHLLEAVRAPLVKRGVERLELSWTLEDNRPMRHIKERIGARVYKTYRIYEKELGG